MVQLDKAPDYNGTYGTVTGVNYIVTQLSLLVMALILRELDGLF